MLILVVSFFGIQGPCVQVFRPRTETLFWATWHLYLLSSASAIKRRRVVDYSTIDSHLWKQLLDFFVFFVSQQRGKCVGARLGCYVIFVAGFRGDLLRVSKEWIFHAWVGGEGFGRKGICLSEKIWMTRFFVTNYLIFIRIIIFMLSF